VLARIAAAPELISQIRANEQSPYHQKSREDHECQDREHAVILLPRSVALDEQRD
jgi:hypothetical protein